MVPREKTCLSGGDVKKNASIYFSVGSGGRTRLKVCRGTGKKFPSKRLLIFYWFAKILTSSTPFYLFGQVSILLFFICYLAASLPNKKVAETVAYASSEISSFTLSPPGTKRHVAAEYSCSYLEKLLQILQSEFRCCLHLARRKLWHFQIWSNSSWTNSRNFRQLFPSEL